VDLFQQLQSQLAGSQAGQGVSDGIMPSSSQPRGAPQLWIKAIAATRTEIDNLNKLADQLRQAGLDEEDKDVIDATRKMQSVLDKLKKRQLDLTSGQM
jgi:hypothetical protein